MARELRISPNAAEQIRAASAWWNENRRESPDLLRTELARAFELITLQPGIGAPADDDDFDSLRRVTLRRTRYHLYYQVYEEDVEVLALWHLSRGTGPTFGGPA